jgi:hypothetical protein
MNYVKFPVVLSAVMAVMLLAGCFASSHDDGRAPEPGDYTEAMALFAAEVREVDRHVIAGSIRLATDRTAQALQYATALGQFEPPRGQGSYAEYKDYDSQVADLRRATDRLLYMLQQRRDDDIRDMLTEVASRYNRLSMNYGPERTLSVLNQPVQPYTAADRYGNTHPEDLRGR